MKSAKAGPLKARDPRVPGLYFITAAESGVLLCILSRKTLAYRIGWGKGTKRRSRRNQALKEA